MWIAAAVVLAAALLLLVAITTTRNRASLREATEILRSMGDELGPPVTIDVALDRIRSRAKPPVEDFSNRRTEVALDQMGTGAVVVDPSGQVTFRNVAAEPFASGRHGNALVQSAIESRIEEALAGNAGDQELTLHGPPERHLRILGTPLVDGDELLGALVLIDDISEQYRLDSIRRDFVANVSHELRTPVGAMSLLAETLAGETDPDVIDDFLDRIQSETHRLNLLIEDLLDLSKVEEGSSSLMEPQVLESIVQEAASAVRENAQHREIELGFQFEDDVPEVKADRSQLLSAITNLFENAIKYSDAGDSVSGRVVSHGDEVAIAVVDTGIGIPQRDQTRIFERFYRVDRARASDTGGTGLGLAIVRNVAVNHGGRVELTSQEGVGSTFTLILPALPAASENDHQKEHENSDG